MELLSQALPVGLAIEKDCLLAVTIP